MKAISLILSAQLFLGCFPVASFGQDMAGILAQMKNSGAIEKEYFIEAGDVININVFPAQEFSKEVTVQPDGTIEIPLLGSMKAQGLKPADLEKMLTARFSKYVSNPSISLSVRRFSFSRVAIIGQSKGTGYYEYREGMRLLDLVAQAGGLEDYAKGGKVRIFRKLKTSEDKVVDQVLYADLEGLLKGEMDKNIPLATGDIVYVPRKPYSTAAKWITDNIIPWTTLFLFTITAGIVINNRR